MRSFLFIAGFFLFCTQMYTATIYVPDDFAAIQGSINAAVDGDTIIVRPGTYYENIDFIGKPVHLRSEFGPLVTTINGQRVGRVVTCHRQKRSRSILEGFTITNGLAVYGGGISIYNSSQPPVIKDNIITGNEAIEDGGGIFCYGTNSIIVGNIIEYNSATYSAGGIYATNANPTIIYNKISYNLASFGAGIDFYYADSSITSNIIYENTATLHGGGISTNWSRARINNNIIYNNTAAMNGGGINSINEVAPILINNTIYGNHAEIKGGGIYDAHWEGEMKITNTIIWNNTAPKDPQIDGSPVINFCCIEGGWHSGTGNINSDPVFIQPSQGDFRLTFPSPCKDMGENNVSELPAEDFEGDSRIYNWIVDIGADEFAPRLYYTGNIIPGERIWLRVIGQPGYLATIGLGTDLRNFPRLTPYGLLYLQYPIQRFAEGTISSLGLFSIEREVPTYWSQGENHYLQALIGNELSNLLTVTVK